MVSSNKSADEEIEVNEGWAVGAGQRLNSTHVEWFPMRASLNTGYGPAGIPLNFSFGGISRGLRKASLTTSYSYSTFFSSKGYSNDVNQRVEAEGKYQFRYNLKGRLKLERKWKSSEQNGNTGLTGLDAGLKWRPTYRSSLSAGTSHYMNDDGSEGHSIGSSYSQGLMRGANFMA